MELALVQISVYVLVTAVIGAVLLSVLWAIVTSGKHRRRWLTR